MSEADIVEAEADVVDTVSWVKDANAVQIALTHSVQEQYMMMTVKSGDQYTGSSSRPLTHCHLVDSGSLCRESSRRIPEKIGASNPNTLMMIPGVDNTFSTFTIIQTLEMQPQWIVGLILTWKILRIMRYQLRT